MKAKDCTVIKLKITPDMVGKDCLVFAYPIESMQFKNGCEMNAAISEIDDKTARSLSQLGLYWAACKLVADNSTERDWSTADYVHDQVRIATRHIKHWIHYSNPKTGEQMLNVKLKSVSFAELPHLEACGFFDRAFEIMADKLGVDVETLIKETKSKMHSGGAR